jgi:hypothetical protein
LSCSYYNICHYRRVSKSGRDIWPAPETPRLTCDFMFQYPIAYQPGGLNELQEKIN